MEQDEFGGRVGGVYDGAVDEGAWVGDEGGDGVFGGCEEGFE